MLAVRHPFQSYARTGATNIESENEQKKADEILEPNDEVMNRFAFESEVHSPNSPLILFILQF